MIDPEINNIAASPGWAKDKTRSIQNGTRRNTATSSDAATEISPQGKPQLICFSHLRWDFVWQRPQHLLSLAAGQFDVLFIEEPLFEAIPAPRLSLSHQPNGIRVAVPHLPEPLTANQRIAAQRALIGSFLKAQKRLPTVFWYYTPMAIAFSADLHRDLTVYDNMDELSAFRGASPELLALEETLLRKADVVFTGGISLYEAKRGRHANLHAFPSSIDVDHFVRARAARKARIGRIGPGSQPRLGFFGVIDERLDADLVDGIAARRPEWQIDMVGPVVKIDPASLPRRPNIHWLGSCAYAELPDRIAAWEVGIMPFALNEATRFISPTKTPEFLAAGLPVVSTPIVDVVRTYGHPGLVEIGTVADDFVAAVERSLLRPEQPWLDSVDRHLARSSWTATWAAMHALMMRSMTPLVAPSQVTRDRTRRLWESPGQYRVQEPSASMAETV